MAEDLAKELREIRAEIVTERAEHAAVLADIRAGILALQKAVDTALKLYHEHQKDAARIDDCMLAIRRLELWRAKVEGA